MGFSRQEYWSGLPCLPPGDPFNPEIEPMSLMSPALLGRFFATKATWEALNDQKGILNPELSDPMKNVLHNYDICLPTGMWVPFPRSAILLLLLRPITLLLFLQGQIS